MGPSFTNLVIKRGSMAMPDTALRTLCFNQVVGPRLTFATRFRWMTSASTRSGEHDAFKHLVRSDCCPRDRSTILGPFGTWRRASFALLKGLTGEPVRSSGQGRSLRTVFTSIDRPCRQQSRSAFRDTRASPPGRPWKVSRLPLSCHTHDWPNRRSNGDQGSSRPADERLRYSQQQTP